MSQDISWEVLQRELVEATQQLIIAEADLKRRQTEARNAEANRDAAQAKVDDIAVAYDVARGVTASAAVESPSRAPTHPTVSQSPAKADEAPSL